MAESAELEALASVAELSKMQASLQQEARIAQTSLVRSQNVDGNSMDVDASGSQQAVDNNSEIQITSNNNHAEMEDLQENEETLAEAAIESMSRLNDDANRHTSSFREHDSNRGVGSVADCDDLQRAPAFGTSEEGATESQHRSTSGGKEMKLL